MLSSVDRSIGVAPPRVNAKYTCITLLSCRDRGRIREIKHHGAKGAKSLSSPKGNTARRDVTYSSRLGPFFLGAKDVMDVDLFFFSLALVRCYVRGSRSACCPASSMLD